MRWARYPAPMAVNDTERRAARFDWHPEPDLIGFGDESSRPALEALGRDAWDAALDYLYDHAFVRAMGQPAGYRELRETFFGPTGRPSPAPADPTPSAALLDEFRERVAPHQLNAYHPRSLSYFTPPPLAMSVVGELLAQVVQQGVDVWHAGPLATFVEEEVVRWLCDLVGYDETSFGLLTSGGVMANFLAMALVRDVHLAAAARAGPRRRGARRSRARGSTRPTRRTSRSRGRSTSWASRPRRSSSCRPTTASASTRSPSPRRSRATGRRA